MVWFLGNGLWIIWPLQNTLIQCFSKLSCFICHHHFLFYYCGRSSSCQLQPRFGYPPEKTLVCLGSKCSSEDFAPASLGIWVWAARSPLSFRATWKDSIGAFGSSCSSASKKLFPQLKCNIHTAMNIQDQKIISYSTVHTIPLSNHYIPSYYSEALVKIS